MKALSILHEVEIVYKRPLLSKMPQISTSLSVEPLLRQAFDSNKIDLKEFFFVMLLSHSNHVLGISELSKGTTAGTLVNVKEVFQLALKANASSIILSHNHPSGQLEPSKADEEITRQIKNAGILLEIKLLDHLILTSEGYYSFCDRGIL